MAATTPTKSVNSSRSEKGKAVGVVIGGMLVHLSLGTVYTFGNINPYLTSYMRKTGVSSDLTYTQCSWVYALASMGQGLTMFLGGILERKIGPRLTTLLGGWIMSIGVALTYFSVQHSFPLVLLTYGLMRGIGVGIAYAVPLSCAIKWLPNRKGLASGFIVAGFGGGAFIFDRVQTSYINPNNVTPDLKIGEENYFQENDVLNRVPSIFLLLGACYAVMQVVGSMLLGYPSVIELQSSDADSKQSLLDNRIQTKTRPDDHGMTPRQMLGSKYYYMLFFMFLLTSHGVIFLSTLYKAYGQTFIEDDNFLSLVGTFAAVFNSTGRIFWGTLADKFSFRMACLLMNTALTALMLTFQLTQLQGKFLFLMYVCLLFGTFSGCYSLFPTATAKCFGGKYIAVNYGLVFFNQVITAPVGVFTAQMLMASIGWSGLFFVISGCSFCSLLLTVAFNAKQPNGDEI